MLNLPSVTLVMIETRNHALARMAVEDCLAKVAFGDVLIFTDRLSEFANLSACVHLVPNWSKKLDWCKFRWGEVSPYLKTSHALFIEWDAWVWDVSMWSDEFLNYDYIGAPWELHVKKSVGGGGFSLISTRLKRFLRANLKDYPCVNVTDDAILCCAYRPSLEMHGFVWAPEKVAHRFSLEYCRPSPTSRHFGFHSAFNFNEVSSHDRLIERTKLMLKSEYITRVGGPTWDGFMLKNADLVNELKQ